MKNALTQLLLTATFVVSPFFLFAYGGSSSGDDLLLLSLCSLFLLVPAGIIFLIRFISKPKRNRKTALIVFALIQIVMLLPLLQEPKILESKVFPLVIFFALIELLFAILVKVVSDEKLISKDKGKRLNNPPGKF